jgi:hypothetical protein
MSWLARPISWKLSSVKFQPLWQVLHCALALKSANPRLAASEIALSSPSIHASKGARRKPGPLAVAIALAMFFVEFLARECG